MAALKIFVIGANGFIGEHLVVKMLEQGHHVLAVSHSSTQDAPSDVPPNPYPSNLSWLNLDLLNSAEVLTHISGCDCVVHLPHNLQDTWQVQFKFVLDSNQILLNACAEAGVKKFILVGSTSVYGDSPPSTLITEDFPHLASLRPRTSLQQAVEKLVLTADAGNTEVIVLQMSQVYGPGTGGETAQTLNQMKKTMLPLVRGGVGYCNPLYIDDCTTAIIRACTTSSLGRQRFIISHHQPVSWNEFLSSYEVILGEKALTRLPIDYPCTPQDSIPLWQELFKKRKVMEGMSAISKALYGKPIAYPSPEEFRSAIAQPIFSNQKSCEVLGFQPQVSLKAGMDQVREWWYTTHHKTV